MDLEKKIIHSNINIKYHYKISSLLQAIITKVFGLRSADKILLQNNWTPFLHHTQKTTQNHLRFKHKN